MATKVVLLVAAAMTATAMAVAVAPPSTVPDAKAQGLNAAIVKGPSAPRPHPRAAVPARPSKQTEPADTSEDVGGPQTRHHGHRSPVRQ